MGITTIDHQTITAVSTPPGCGGIAVIRLSGPDALTIITKCWKGKSLRQVNTHTAHLGMIADNDGCIIDEVVATVFKGPHSFTGEDTVELSCHGSIWIQQAIVSRLIECGARAAEAGEFTKRAFVNGRLDLAQAEAVADIISASSKAAARMANTQMRGDFSRQLEKLREELVDIASLLELELDFSEEDVEFADRTRLLQLTADVTNTTKRLSTSYKAGTAFKHGIPTAIAGIPNAGKSSLLNALLHDDRSIVSDIPGTTRDIIEDTTEIQGLLFRFIDTAGLRDSNDTIETRGIDRARLKIADANIILWLIDPFSPIDIKTQLDKLAETANHCGHTFILITKHDMPGYPEASSKTRNALRNAGIPDTDILDVSATTGHGIDQLETVLVQTATSEYNPESELIITNARHYAALCNATDSLHRLTEGLQTGLSADLLAQELREAIHYIGTITGTVTTDNILHTIFSRFCIGK